MNVYLISGEGPQEALAHCLVGKLNCFDVGATVCRPLDPEYRAEKIVTFLLRLQQQIAEPVAVAVYGLSTLAEQSCIKKHFPGAVHFWVLDEDVVSARKEAHELAAAADFRVELNT